MAENKTQKTKASVDQFIKMIDDKHRREDTQAVLAMMKSITRLTPEMWGTSIIGFGNYRYKYASGREGDWFYVGLSPRKQALTLYIMPGFSGYDDLMSKLGKYKTGKSCLYIKNLKDVDTKVLKQLIKESVAAMKKMYKDGSSE